MLQTLWRFQRLGGGEGGPSSIHSLQSALEEHVPTMDMKSNQKKKRFSLLVLVLTFYFANAYVQLSFLGFECYNFIYVIYICYD